MKIQLTCILLCLIALVACSQATCQSVLSPETALDGYLNNSDSTFSWQVKDSFDLGRVKAYDILLTSQQWHEYVWRHQLTILVPSDNNFDGALLFVTGGSNLKGLPKWNGKDDNFTHALSEVARRNKAIVAILRQTPNQPLVGDLTEDALISYTLHKFKEDGDYSWPLLFPMVKSAVRAMDAVQQFSDKVLNHQVNRFVVSGASKRGWTTWLTGASDRRVAAIAPMVIDILNMPVNLDYQVLMWNDYSVQIQDYVKLGIPQTARTEKGQAITTMVDPYSYRKKLTMPKMIVMGTNDEYWTVDAIKHYIDSIPGQNLIHYVPNVGHSLGDKQQALAALSAFFGHTLAGISYPLLDWDLSQNAKAATLEVRTSRDILVDAILWSADSEDTDFRDEAWQGHSLQLKKNRSAVITAEQPFPEKGYRAFYLDLKYQNPNGGVFTESTRMFVADEDEVFLK